MGYKNGSKIPKEIVKKEIALLKAGFTYGEVAKKLRVKSKTVAERNRLIYKIDIWKAFEERIKREGIPVRLNVSDSFGYLFSGFCDGEATFVAFYRMRKVRGKEYPENRLGIQITLRQDDVETLKMIKKELNCGFLLENQLPPSRKGGHPYAIWGCRRIKDLAEIIVPLFDRYPLRSKKRLEYQYWKQLVQRWYIITLGGLTTRNPISESDLAMFRDYSDRIKALRSFPNGI